MTQKTSEKIIQYIIKNNQVSGRELAEYLHDISPRAVRKQLKTLFERGMIQKIGKPPKVYYSIAQAEAKNQCEEYAQEQCCKANEDLCN